MSLTSIIGVSLGITFVAIAGFNIGVMLRASDPSQDTARRARLIRVHRLGGYIFLALFLMMFYYMNSRVLGANERLAKPVMSHIVLALLLIPLLFLKVMIARYFKSHSAVLLPLGLAIFIVSSLLVSVTTLPHIWAALSIESIPLSVSIGVIIAICVSCGTLSLRRPAVRSSAAALSTAPSDHTKPSQPPVSIQQTSGRKSLILRLARIQAQTHDTTTLRFLVAQDDKLLARPGQFLTFNWIVDGKSVMRSYSICSSPLQTGYIEITPKRTQDGYVSVFLNERAQVGLTVEATGPYGQFYFDEMQHKSIVLIVGGSGITPIMSMLRYIDDRCLATDVNLLYFVRTPKDIIFATELQQLRASIKSLRYVVVVSKSDETWKGQTGHLNQEVLQNNVRDFRLPTFFLCGPQGLMESARGLLGSLGVPDSRIRQESFGEKPALPALEQTEMVEGTVEFAVSRKTCKLLHGKTLLEIAEINRISIPFGCRQGRCGTCAVRVLSGRVRMDIEEGLTPEQEKHGYVLPCVGHAEGDVRLDV